MNCAGHRWTVYVVYCIALAPRGGPMRFWGAWPRLLGGFIRRGVSSRLRASRWASRESGSASGDLVYVICGDHGLVKIGTSANPTARTVGKPSSRTASRCPLRPPPMDRALPWNWPPIGSLRTVRAMDGSMSRRVLRSQRCTSPQIGRVAPFPARPPPNRKGPRDPLDRHR